MSKRHIKFATLLFLASVAAGSSAQEASLDVLDKAIVSVFQMNNAKVLCLNTNSSLPEIRKIVETHMQQQGTASQATANEVAKAAYTVFPCPFSPYREELRHASAKDIEGVWLYPETSQKLRFGPKSPMWSQFSAMPMKCEAVGYYPEGELRNVQIRGRTSCPFSWAKDVEVSRAYPKVSSWKMVRDGALHVARSDVQDHVEEWEMFLVAKAFVFAGVQFNEGDLAAYLRRENGNDFNVATVFRHLRRLP